MASHTLGCIVFLHVVQTNLSQVVSLAPGSALISAVDVSLKGQLLNQAKATDTKHATLSGIVKRCLILNCCPVVPRSHPFGLKASKVLQGERSSMDVDAAENKSQAGTAATQEKSMLFIVLGIWMGP